MSAKYCPSWMFNLCTASTAYEFIISDLPIRSYAKKYSKGLNEHYGEIKSEEIESAAETILRFLVEINADNSDELLNAYIYYCLKYNLDGTKRKIKGLFGTAFDPDKEKKFSEKDCIRTFRSYVFGLRSGVTSRPVPGWDIKEEENIDQLLDIIKQDANIGDAL